MPEGRYNARDIEILDGLEAVRRRPRLYLGDTSLPAALTQVLLEPLCLAVDEKTGGLARNVRVVLRADDTAEVANDGPGLPLGNHPQTGLPFVQIIMTKLMACRDAKNEEANRRWCGVGIAVLNAMSEWCVVTTRRDGGLWEQRFEKGQPASKFERRGDCTNTGTTVAFKPDRGLLTGVFDAAAIMARLHEFEADTPCVAVTFEDRRGKPPPPELR